MIKNTELRIGNWIMENGEPSIVYNIDKGGISFYRINDIPVNKETHCTLNGGERRFEGIPLSPEILEKCGFKAGVSKGISRISDDLDYDPEEHGDTFYWDLKFPKNEQVEGLGAFSLVQFGEGNPIVWSHQWLRVKVKNLHELQNLYWCLCGEELQVLM